MRARSAARAMHHEIMKLPLLTLTALLALTFAGCENLEPQPVNPRALQGPLEPGDVGSDLDTAPITGGGARPPRAY